MKKMKLLVQRKDLYAGKDICQKETEGSLKPSSLRLETTMKLFLEILDEMK